MNPTPRRAGALLALLALVPVAASAQDDAATRRDLFSVIVLQGKPCAAVETYVKKGERDYLVTCTGGERYRVRVDTAERVIVEPI